MRNKTIPAREQQAYHELQTIHKEYLSHAKNHPYNDIIRNTSGEENHVNKREEFCTEAVTEPLFMQYLSEIPYKTQKSRYEFLMKENLKET